MRINDKSSTRHNFHHSRLGICLALLVFAQCQTGGESQNEYCTLKKDALQQCNGKPVRLNAHRPEMILQHPITQFEKVESYWETEFGQWIFISDSAIDCARDVQVTGTLQTEVGPCQPTSGTRNEYCGTAVHVSEWACR